MRKVSQNEFDRLQKRKGVTVRRKMGAQKKPEPVVEDRKVLSGTRQPEKPVPALPSSDQFYSLMSKMTNIMERLEPSAADKRPFQKMKEATEVEKVVQPIKLKVVKPALVTLKVPKVKSKSWTHIVEREKGLMSKIISTDADGNEWIHKPVRSRNGLIESVTTTSV